MCLVTTDTLVCVCVCERDDDDTRNLHISRICSAVKKILNTDQTFWQEFIHDQLKEHENVDTFRCHLNITEWRLKTQEIRFYIVRLYESRLAVLKRVTRFIGASLNTFEIVLQKSVSWESAINLATDNSITIQFSSLKIKRKRTLSCRNNHPPRLDF